MQKHITLTNNLNLTITQAQPDDAKQIITYLNAIGGQTDFLTFGLNEFHISEEEEKTILTQSLKNNLSLFLVGKINNKVISILSLQRSDKARLAHVGELGLSVLQKYWGLSIGKHLMLTGIEWAKNNSITKLQLTVHTNNERAIGLYKKFGFVIEGTLTQTVKIDSTYFDTHIMGLII
ncbi:MAG: GNAT family N-acetyltransferase [bacterium]